MITAPSLPLIMSIEGMLSEDEAAILCRLASEATGLIVEIGGYRGRSTVALALGSRAGAGQPVYAIDPHEEFTEPGGFHFGRIDAVEQTRNLLNAGVADLVRRIELPAEMVGFLPGAIGLLWIDGDHEQALRDYRQFAGQLALSAVVVFHDSGLPNVQDAIAAAQADGFTVIQTCGPMTVMER